MNIILEKKQLSKNVYSMDIHAPMIANESQAGQFIIISLNNGLSERIPLTIADSNFLKNYITIIFQVVGKTTFELSLLNKGDKILNILGPLGKPTHIKNFGKVVCVAGGIGVAPLYPIVKAMKNANNKITVIIGFRTKYLIIYKDKMKEISDNLIICTDDGSYGKKAIITEPLREICKEWNPNLAVAIGPAKMMKSCAETTKLLNIPIIVSLNTIMIDGTGMCGGCRVTVGQKTKFVCVDGPEFDGHQVDFDNMITRLNAYKDLELESYHQCKINKK